MRFERLGFELLTLPIALAFAAPHAPTLVEIRDGIDRADRIATSAIESYTVVRHYRLNHPGLGREAEMRVRLGFSPDRGKTFEVLSIEHADGIQRRVFARLLEAEKESTSPEKVAGMRLNSSNYDFEFLGEAVLAGRLCYVVGIHPKRKSRTLLEGKAWISVEDFGLVRLEGQPQERASFWVGRAQVVQTYQKFGPVWVMGSNHSVADVRLLGKAELTVESSDFDLKFKEGRELARSQPSCKSTDRAENPE